MDNEFYLERFRWAADKIDTALLAERQLEIWVGTVLESVCLKIYKRQWCSDPVDPLNARSRIFFSVWVNDRTIGEGKVYYNIHAFKLRELKGYSISSRSFADDFRSRFKGKQDQWPNVRVKYGPLTLMGGWEQLITEKLENQVAALADSFTATADLIDNTFERFEK